MSLALLRRELNDPFQFWGNFEREFERPKAGESFKGFYPEVDFTEEEDHYLLSADLPGLKKEDINLELKNGELSLKGRRESKIKSDGYSERKFGEFQRTLKLPEDVDTETIEASFENGELHIILSKSEKRGTTKIEIGS